VIGSAAERLEPSAPSVTRSGLDARPTDSSVGPVGSFCSLAAPRRRMRPSLVVDHGVVAASCGLFARVTGGDL
jgi:hypothetical protein